MSASAIITNIECVKCDVMNGNERKARKMPGVLQA
jgi:hypothetical protein